MLKRVLFIALTGTLFLGASCPPSGTGGNNNSDNLLLPRTWNQVYAGKENSGFNAVHSPFAVLSARKWTASVGQLAYSSPVIGPDGVIYIGNASGELVALSPSNGTELWRRKLANSILSTPVVNPETNEIIVLAQEPSNNSFISKLYRVGSIGQLFTVATEGVLTTSAPKIWKNFVFLPAGSRLFLYDQSSLTRLGFVDGDACFNLVCGEPAPLWPDSALNLLTCIATLGFSDLIGLTDADCLGASFTPGMIPGNVAQPSVAIADAAALVGDPNKPIIVMSGPQCVSAFRFYPNGDAPQNPLSQDTRFELLWSRALVEVDCDFKTIGTTTPAIMLGGQVIVGDTNGRVRSFDLLTGNPLWNEWLISGGSVQSPPVASLRQIYVVTRHFLYVLDSDGTQLSTWPLFGTGRGIALSLDYVYVTADLGVHTYSLNPHNAFKLDLSTANTTSQGISIPILGEDGTVYVSMPTGFINAYGATVTPIFNIFPGVFWQNPTEGATISYRAGQSLTATVSGTGGAAFDGSVSFTSDVDGMLCDALIPENGTATCTTANQLTLGTHLLTVFANDSEGGTDTARITVEVVNTAPTVAIQQPPTNTVVQQGTQVQFVAGVTDPDEPNFPAMRIQWSSNIDGNLGTGASITTALTLGEHTITVLATDELNATGQATVMVTVVSTPVDNTAPTVVLNEPANDATLFTGTLINFSATVTDPEEPAFPDARIVWQSNIDGELGTGASITSMLSEGTHTITVIATDAQGLTGQASVNILVTPPIL